MPWRSIKSVNQIGQSSNWSESLSELDCTGIEMCQRSWNVIWAFSTVHIRDNNNWNDLKIVYNNNNHQNYNNNNNDNHQNYNNNRNWPLECIWVEPTAPEAIFNSINITGMGSDISQQHKLKRLPLHTRIINNINSNTIHWVQFGQFHTSWMNWTGTQKPANHICKVHWYNNSSAEVTVSVGKSHLCCHTSAESRIHKKGSSHM